MNRHDERFDFVLLGPTMSGFTPSHTKSGHTNSITSAPNQVSVTISITFVDYFTQPIQLHHNDLQYTVIVNLVRTLVNKILCAMRSHFRKFSPAFKRHSFKLVRASPMVNFK